MLNFQVDEAVLKQQITQAVMGSIVGELLTKQSRLHWTRTTTKVP